MILVRQDVKHVDLFHKLLLISSHAVDIFFLISLVINESAEETSGICIALFREMGADVSINDIDTAHRVPGRNNSSHDPKPKAIICKFVRRLARDKVMAKRADANKANPTALGFTDIVSLTAARVFEHLTPRLQTHSRSSTITSIAGPRMVIFIFARVMTQEPFGLRKSPEFTSLKFKEEDKLNSFHS